ncbi:PREDICTED: MICOS complex subunit MIC27 isoform X2 [Dinoponera quadriceps]|uniref:MICOS complex subunit n=1 Tax=Dinoponera quadriceps TaxID=609295 RepID=A0A6P3YI02_DINQU|nr:PREDICTED: MICOS complex subunit MIC27 isoform X2 [Dinoponera quadriceps]
MFFKKILMPCGLYAALPAALPAANPTSSPGDSMLSHNKETATKKLIRPSELPIYPLEDDYTKQISCTDCPPSFLEQNISKIRKSAQAVASEYQHYTGVISDSVNIGFEHSRSLLDYLHEESNVMPRMGAIGIGGLTGLIFGLRGRIFKRLIYSSTGALTMAGLCYPKKAEEGLDLTKHYVNVGYNFIYGEKSTDSRDECEDENRRETKLEGSR